MEAKEIVIVYDTPSKTHLHLLYTHNLVSLQKHFDRIHVLYWSNEDRKDPFSLEAGLLTFYPYSAPYQNGYIAGVKFMFWIAKTLSSVSKLSEKDTRMVFMPIIPIWAGIPTLLVGKLKRRKVVLRMEASKMEYIKLQDKLEGRPHIATLAKVLILKAVYATTIPLYDYVIGISESVSEEARKYRGKRVITIPVSFSMDLWLQECEAISCAWPQSRIFSIVFLAYHIDLSSSFSNSFPTIAHVAETSYFSNSVRIRLIIASHCKN